MIATALIAAGGVAVFAAFVLFLLAREFGRRERVWERRLQLLDAERRDLVNRIMFMADKTYELPFEPLDAPAQEIVFVPDALDEPFDTVTQYGEFDDPDPTISYGPVSPAARV